MYREISTQAAGTHGKSYKAIFSLNPPSTTISLDEFKKVFKEKLVSAGYAENDIEITNIEMKETIIEYEKMPLDLSGFNDLDMTSLVKLVPVKYKEVIVYFDYNSPVLSIVISLIALAITSFAGYKLVAELRKLFEKDELTGLSFTSLIAIAFGIFVIWKMRS